MKKRCWWPRYSHIIISLLAMAFLVCSCSISFTKPDKIIETGLNLLIQEGGYLLAQENSELAKAILAYSKKALGKGLENFTEPDFHKWAEVVMKELKIEPRIEMKFKEILKLVNVKIEPGKSSKEIVELAYNVIETFIVGIEAGIK